MAVRWWVEDCFFFQAEDGIRDLTVTGVQTCALPISIAAIGLPGVLKTRRLGYDGKGQAVIRTAADARRAWSALGAAPLLYEEWIPFDCEASIIGARSVSGQLAVYPLCGNVHGGGVLRLTRAPLCPPRLPPLAAPYLTPPPAPFRFTGILSIAFLPRRRA